MTEAAHDSFSSKVSFNMVTNIVRTVIMALIGLLMVPYYIGEFGLAVYAIIPLVITVTTYFIAVADSLANAFTRYTVISIQRGDEDAISRTFTSSFVGMCKCMLALLPLVLIVSIASSSIFDIASANALDVQLMFFMVLSSSLMISFSACLNSVFMAYNVMYITYLSRIVHCTLQVGLVLLFFFITDPSLTLIGVSYLVSSAVLLAILALNLKKVCPSLRLSKEYYDPGLLKRMSGLGLWALISEFGSLMFIQASMIVVNLMLGSYAQGSFSIAANVISMVNTACASISAASVPLTYRCYAQKDVEGMVRTLRVFTKLVGLLMAFPLAYIIIFAPQVIQIWLGPGHEDLYRMLYIMLPAEIAVCTVNSLISVPVVYERMKSVALVTILTGIFNIILSILILQYTSFGVEGVCLAWAISMFFLKAVFYPIYASRLTDGTNLKYFYPIVYSYVIFGILLIIGFELSHVVVVPATWLSVASTFLVGFSIYFIIMVRLLLTRSEREEAMKYLPRAVQRVLHG